MDEKSLDDSSDKKNDSDGKQGFTDAIRENPWIASTIILGVVALILIVGSFTGLTGSTITGGAIGVDDAGNNLLNFANQQGANAELVGTKDIGDFYEVTLLISGNEVPLMVTKDGKYFLSGNLIPLISETDNSDSQTTEVPKSDKPVVELFIWGYCPYGVQAQGPLAEVASLLGNSADFKTVLYYDGHGAFETQQNKIQECIQKISPEKYWDYASGFVETIYPKCSSSRDIECDKTESVKLMNSLGINSNNVLSCVDSQGETLISDASARAEEFGVTGSPTLVINGVKADSARTADAYKEAVCSAFTDTPSECSTALSTTSTATSGNC